MANTVLYWRGAIDANVNLDTSDEVLALVDKLLTGMYKEADLEILRGHQVYSARLNERDRLLFTTTRRHNKQFLVILEVIYEHRYAQSRFLKPAVLKKFMQKNGETFSEVIKASDFGKADELPYATKSRKTNRALRFAPADLNHHQFIVFDDGQNQANHAPLPVEIDGPAGSGKTLVALSIIRNTRAIALANGEDSNILFVAKSSLLVDTMRKRFAEFPEEVNCSHAGQVEFYSYFQLLAKYDPAIGQLLAQEPSESKLADEVFFKNWLKGYIDHYRKITRHTPSFDEGFFTKTGLIYQEFCIISGFQEEEDYLSLGKKNTQFSDSLQHKWLYGAFATYKKALQSSHTIDLAFHALQGIAGQYDLVIVDEAQDLTFWQLKLLFLLARSGKIVFCVDTHQSLQNEKSIRPYLQKLCEQNHLTLTHVPLNRTYRSGSDIIEVTNALIQLKMCFTRGLSDKRELAAIPLLTDAEHPRGKVRILKDEAKLASLIARFGNSTDFAIVTRPEFIEALRVAYPNIPFIYTPEEIKGLEHRYIVIIDLLSHPVFGEANKYLGANHVSKHYQHRAKTTGNQEASVATYFNEVITALTRATDRVYFHQSASTPYALNHIMGTIETIVTEQKARVSLNHEKPMTVTHASEADWKEQYELQRQQGNTRIADDILKNKLKSRRVEKPAIITPVINEIPPVPKATPPNTPAPTPAVTSARRQPGNRKNMASGGKRGRAPVGQKPIVALAPDQITVTEKVIAEKKAELNALFAKNTIIRAKLFALLNNKRFDPLDMLFNYLEPNCLFSELIVSPAKYKSWMSKAPLNKILKNLTPELLCKIEGTQPPPLYYLAAFLKDYRDLWNNLLKKQGFIEGVTVEALSYSHPVGKFSALSLLSITTAGNDLSILRQLFKNKHIVQQISKETLFGLWDMIAYNFTELNSLSKHILTRVKPADLFGTQKSTFEWLSMRPDGIELLKLIFDSNAMLKQEITWPILCGSSDSFYASPLAHMITNPTGQALLKTLIRDNPGLSNAISGESLSIFHINHYRPMFEAVKDACRVHHVSKINRDVVSKSILFDYAAICEPFRDMETFSHISFFSLLAKYEHASGLLGFMLECNPSIAEGITIHYLCQFPQDNYCLYLQRREFPRPEIAPLGYLARSINGLNALKKLLIHNKAIIGEMTVEYFSIFVYMNEEEAVDSGEKSMLLTPLAKALVEDDELYSLFCENANIKEYLVNLNFLQNKTQVKKLFEAGSGHFFFPSEKPLQPAETITEVKAPSSPR